jgi:hypothetical protein
MEIRCIFLATKFVRNKERREVANKMFWKSSVEYGNR